MLILTSAQPMIINILLGVAFGILLLFEFVKIRISRILQIICATILLVITVIQMVILHGLITKIFAIIAIVLWIIMIIRLSKEINSKE